MTFEEFGRRLKDKVYPGAYDDVPDRDLALAFLQKHPEYLDMISPTARRIMEMSNEAVGHDFHLIGATTRNEEDRAKILLNRAAAATSLHQMDMTMEANALGVPVTVLATLKDREHQVRSDMLLESHRTDLQKQLETHKTDQLIRLEVEKANIELQTLTLQADIKLEKARIVELEGIRTLNDLRDKIFALYDERQRLLESGDPHEEAKLQILDDQIEMLKGDFRGRARGLLVQAPDAEVGQGQQVPGGTDTDDDN